MGRHTDWLDNGATVLYADGDAGACYLGPTEVPTQASSEQICAVQSPTPGVGRACLDEYSTSTPNPTVTPSPTPAACSVDAATPGYPDPTPQGHTSTPGSTEEPTPQATATPDPTMGPTPTIPVATPTRMGPTSTPTSIPSSTPEPEPTGTDTPVPTETTRPEPTATMAPPTETSEPKPSKTPRPTRQACNHGGGNGHEGCDPGSDPTQANDDGDHTPQP